MAIWGTFKRRNNLPPRPLFGIEDLQKGLKMSTRYIRVYITDNFSMADESVYITKDPELADEVVHIVDSSEEADKWVYLTNLSRTADRWVYVVNPEKLPPDFQPG
jgi:hypothetical protein